MSSYSNLHAGQLYPHLRHPSKHLSMASIPQISAAARRLQGKVALITGGASGIGKVLQDSSLDMGPKVVIADIQDNLGLSVCKDLSPTSASFVHCDVTNEKEVENAVNLAVATHGKLDIMCLLGNQTCGSGDDSSGGTCKECSGGARKIWHSCELCVAISGCQSTSKGLLQLDDDGAAGVYSNLKGKVLNAEDVAEAALYLAGDESKYVSGHNLLVDGGFTVVNPSFIYFEEMI
ncbi:Secoisolariciresinol dehydrogenase [Vitis vinifera]|uniref:Secoisolariciresinol dehydrogenase n=1 Tax=Vitis vinifera TaxID=29760 RepID=A0A438DCY4_VITVI|nr:Secoisolariciresinol dehydrogenase [Vitis vinifera]